MKNDPDGKFMTTGQVAKMFRVSIQSVIRWTDNRRLRCVRLPGSGYRRIHRADAERLFQESGVADAIAGTIGPASDEPKAA